MAEFISFQPSDNFKTHLYTGTGASNAQTFPATTAMQPDLTWIKNRDVADFHVLTDSVRGATKYLQSDVTDLSVTNAESLKSFDSDGFTVGTMNEVNTNTEDFVSWNWKMGTTSGIAGSPSITPTAYSLNTTAGQSIITYTGNGVGGATVPHGLGVAPAMIIVKTVTGGSATWQMYHHKIASTAPEDYTIHLNETGVRFDTATRWNDTAPTSTLFSLGTSDVVNYNTYTYVAYCFAQKKGYSKFGEYWGNGQSSDGTFVYTGFRPAFIFTKTSQYTTANWMAYDAKRTGINEENAYLEPNTTQEEYLTVDIDILSNGFKLRDSAASINSSGVTFIFAAFAEFPIVSSNDVPGVAR